jgi:Tol biopolymer transport system component
VKLDGYRTLAVKDGTRRSRARQLTAGPGRFQGAPHWSPDGRRIAFDSEGNDGQWHIWTIDAEGGPPHQITKDRQSKCSDMVERRPDDLFQRVTSQSIYYVACGSDRDPAVPVMNPSTGQDRLIGRLERYSSYYYPMGLPVSPDGTTILYNKVVNDGADLMLIENFR